MNNERAEVLTSAVDILLWREAVWFYEQKMPLQITKSGNKDWQVGWKGQQYAFATLPDILKGVREWRRSQ